MNREKLMESGIDYDSGLERFVGKKELYEKYIGKYLEDPNFENLKKAMAEEDYQTAFVCAHTLKGTTGNLSFQNFLKKLEPVVEALRHGTDIPKAKELMPELVKEHDKLIEAIKEQKDE